MDVRQTMKPLETPKKWLFLGIAGSILIITQPVISVLHYSWNLHMGAYPVNADSIGIPIHYEIISWVVLAPIALCGLWWRVWKYPKARPVWGWNRQRPKWSLFWTIVFGFLIATCVLEIPHALRWLNLPTILNVTLWLILLLWLRAVIVFKRSLIT